MNQPIKREREYPRVVVLSGGVGGARFLSGLARILPAKQITAIVNTGDDLELGGLYISPDVDIVTCTLAGLICEDKGWGIANDTFACRDFLKELGVPIWFNLGDKDLALHLYRTARLREGASFTQIAREIAAQLGVETHILPMSDSRVTSIIRTKEREMTFEEYLVKHRCAPQIKGIRYAGADTAAPTPQVLDAIRAADLIFFAPSNPFVSIGTILALSGMKEALCASLAPVIAISPIVSGNAIKGPAAKMMWELGHAPSAVGVAALYRNIARGFVMDSQDADMAASIEAMGYEVLVIDSLISDPQKRPGFAQKVLDFGHCIACRGEIR